MRADITNLMNPGATPEAKITHGNLPEVIFTVSCFGRSALQVDVGVFDYLNNYWAQLPEKEQLAIYNIYVEIGNIFSSVYDRNQLAFELTQKSVELLNAHEYDRMYRWVMLSPDIIIPQEAFETEYIYSVDRRWTREQTYIRSDYTKLVALSLVMRTMIPVWGEFISSTRRETGTVYKEYYAHQLIRKAKILESEPHLKLCEYIESTINANNSSINNRISSTVVDGVSSEDLPNWMLGLVTIRRLCIGDISGRDPRAHLVSFIHKFITQKMNGADTSPDRIVKEKAYRTDGNELDQKLSSVERYKIRHQLSPGSIVELEYSVSNYKEVAKRLSANMTDELLERCMATAKLLKDYPIKDPQITLLRWVMKPVISSRGILYLSKETTITLLAVAQAVLWLRGHRFLSLFVTCHANPSTDVFNVGVIDSRSRIPKDMVQTINDIYPFQKQPNSKKTEGKNSNMAIRSIDGLTDQLSSHSWVMTADEQFLSEMFGTASTRRLNIPSDIKIQLAKLVIEIGQRSWF